MQGERDKNAGREGCKGREKGIRIQEKRDKNPGIKG